MILLYTYIFLYEVGTYECKAVLQKLTTVELQRTLWSVQQTKNIQANIQANWIGAFKWKRYDP